MLKKTKMTRTISIKKYLRIGILGGLFVFIIFYAILETRSLARGVQIKISGLENGQVFTNENISLTGTAIHADYLSLNDRELAIDIDNNFKSDLVLSPGYNIVTLEAKDRYDKKTKSVYEVFYRPGE